MILSNTEHLFAAAAAVLLLSEKDEKQNARVQSINLGLSVGLLLVIF